MLDARVATFLAVCRNLNYTRAAKELNITQSAVSQHMSFLEKHYGVKLIKFEGKKMTLTDAGLYLKSCYETFLHDETVLSEQIAHMDDKKLRHYNIGTTLTAGEYIVAPHLATWLVEHPEVDVSIVSRCTADLISLLEQGSIDCAFIEGIFDKAAFKSNMLCKQELIAVCSPQSLLKDGTYSIVELLSTPLIVREPESGSRAVLENALAQFNLSLDAFESQIEASSIGIIKALVKANLGISFVYEAAVESEIKNGDLCKIDLADVKIYHDISFVRLNKSIFEDELSYVFHGVKEDYAKHHKQIF